MANTLIDPKQLLAEWEQLQAEFQRLKPRHNIVYSGAELSRLAGAV